MPRVALEGKPIIIAGASSGIGAAAARACARAGMPVLLAARRTERIDAVTKELTDAGHAAHAVTADVTKPDECAAMVDACTEHLGAPYAVYANAGYTFKSTFLDVSEGRLRDIFETNFFGTWNVLRAALPGMVERGSGHAVICSSSIGKIALPRYSAYCATKAAQWPVAHAINAEYRSRGIRATSVHPIGTKTEIFDDVDEPNLKEWQMQSAEHVANRIVGALRRPKLEVWPSFPSLLLAGLATVCPPLIGFGQRRIAAKDERRA